MITEKKTLHWGESARRRRVGLEGSAKQTHNNRLNLNLMEWVENPRRSDKEARA